MLVLPGATQHLGLFSSQFCLPGPMKPSMYIRTFLFKTGRRGRNLSPGMGTLSPPFSLSEQCYYVYFYKTIVVSGAPKAKWSKQGPPLSYLVRSLGKTEILFHRRKGPMDIKSETSFPSHPPDHEVILNDHTGRTR